jgi:hypothetical protein
MARAVLAPVQASSIELGDFQLSVHRREFPDAQDRWDGNWLCVTAQCLRAGAIVSAGGPILEASDLQRFRDQLTSLRAGAARVAELSGSEPHVRVDVSADDARGQLQVRVELTPEPQVQGHWFAFALDPSYLALTVEQLDAVLALFPVRGRVFVPSPEDA